MMKVTRKTYQYNKACNNKTIFNKILCHLSLKWHSRLFFLKAYYQISIFWIIRISLKTWWILVTCNMNYLKILFRMSKLIFSYLEKDQRAYNLKENNSFELKIFNKQKNGSLKISKEWIQGLDSKKFVLKYK